MAKKGSRKETEIKEERLRYVYYGLDEPIVCTCQDNCSFFCKGECGCEAHQLAWADELTMDY